MTKKKDKEEEEVEAKVPPQINPNIVPARPFHKPVTTGSVRPFGGKR